MQTSRLGALAAVLALASLANAALPSWYSCPDTCTGGCRCASTAPPGGLTSSQVPQMILITHDDAVNALSAKLVRAATDNKVNPNGCNVPATFFTLQAGSDCATVMKLYNMNHEIASHTMTHSQLTPTYKNMTWDVLAARDWLVGCGVPREDVVGFRAPYLIHNPTLRNVLAQGGFLYDSSIDEVFPSSTSPEERSRLWGGYSMDYGLPQDCNWTLPYGWCRMEERYAGLWEIPLVDTQDAAGNSLATMDPTASNPTALYQLLVANLRFSYDGNRAPMGVYIHAPWLTATHIEVLQQFISYAQSLPDVWFITARQLVEYMKAPVPKEQMSSFIKCKPVDFNADGPTPCRTYTVKEGDFLYNISQTVGVTIDDLVATNPAVANNAPIFVGQVLRIPPWLDNCTVPSPSPSSPGSSPTPAQPTGPSCRNYTVAIGDSLYVIAARFSVSLNQLVAVNPTVDAVKALMAGTTLHIPPWPESCKTGAPASPSPSPSPVSPPISYSKYLRADLVISGCNATTFSNTYQFMFINGLSTLCSVPAAQVELADVHDWAAPATRRLLAVTPQTFISAHIYSSNVTATASLLYGALQLGSLNTTLSAMSLSVASVNLTQVTTPSASPAPGNSPGSSPLIPPTASPSPSPVPPVIASSNSKLGAILGGAIGGGVGLLLVVGAVVFFVRRRQQDKAGGLRGEDGLRVQYGGSRLSGVPTATLKMITTLSKDEAFSSTPRSATHRNPATFAE